jgi:molybdate transport system substrate-binding protein
MKFHRAIAVIAVLGLPLATTAAQAVDIKLLGGNALNAVMEDLGPQFEKATGNKLVTTLGTSAQLKARIESGEAFDAVLLTKAALDELAAAGKVADAPRAPIARFVDQTPTAAALKAIFAKLGIADEIKAKIKPLNIQAAVAVTNGDVEIAMTQISEILPYPGVELAGPLPPDIQTYTMFSAGISAAAKSAEAAAALIKFLTSPDAKAVIKAKGMEPG